jgi:hypothetical protein
MQISRRKSLVGDVVGRDLANEFSFSKAPNYDVAVAQYTFDNRQPVGINELLSPGFFPNYPKNFTGAAMVSALYHPFLGFQSTDYRPRLFLDRGISSTAPESESPFIFGTVRSGC